MVFNSLSFLLFFIVVFLIYYFPLKEKTSYQNWLLLLASYFFYGFAAWKMVPLLLIATTAFYFVGIAIYNAKSDKTANRITILGVVLGIGMLLYFKYLNFFIESFSTLFNDIGFHVSWSTFNIIIQLGISFFTFKLISYVIEIHRKHIKPCTNFVEFATYIAFFPTILSGPIDRPNNFIPQLQKKRAFDYNLAVDGSLQILCGLFKKMVIADNLATYVDKVWGNIDGASGSTLLIGAIFYSIQIYADFSGYTDMAIGVSKIFGFKITKNFDYPYFSRNVSEFWRKWHISLMDWLKEYVYISLGGNRVPKYRIIINTMVVFLVSGLWHGANWTFVCWGAYHAFLFIPLLLLNKNKMKTPVGNGRTFPDLKEFFQIMLTFLLISFGWIIFRADSLSQAFNYIYRLFNGSYSEFPELISNNFNLSLFCLLSVFLVAEWFGRDQQYAIAQLGVNWKKPLKYALYYAIIIAIFWFRGKGQEYIYFQF